MGGRTDATGNAQSATTNPETIPRQLMPTAKCAAADFGWPRFAALFCAVAVHCIQFAGVACAGRPCAGGQPPPSIPHLLCSASNCPAGAAPIGRFIATIESITLIPFIRCCSFNSALWKCARGGAAKLPDCPRIWRRTKANLLETGVRGGMRAKDGARKWKAIGPSIEFLANLGIRTNGRLMCGQFK